MSISVLCYKEGSWTMSILDSIEGSSLIKGRMSDSLKEEILVSDSLLDANFQDSHSYFVG